MSKQRNGTESPDGRSFPRAVQLLSRHRPLGQVVVDTITWWAALLLAWLLRVDFDWAAVEWRPLLAACIGISGLQLVVGFADGLYSGRHSFGSFEEAAGLARTLLIVTSIATIVNLVVIGVPRSVPPVGGALAMIAMGGSRYLWRLQLDRFKRPQEAGATKVLVFGAGEGGSQLVTSMLRDPSGPYLPVGLIDDDPSKRNLRLRGVRVLGDRRALADAVAATGATVLAIALPSANGALLREVADLASAVGLRTMVLPPLAELFDGRVGVGQLRKLTEADLLGRHEVDTDIESIAGYLTGRRVLVTGAGGSIGAELCRQIHRFGPAELIKLDRDESALHEVELSIFGRALLDSGELVVADIRDAERMQEVFDRFRPEVVFHAAALKHLTLLEQHPTEGIKTNVLGTLTVLEAALKVGVQRFVNISTDKAADPISVLGYTKRAAERLTAWAATQGGGTYLSVRFGNVLGSRGSVLTSFVQQIENGGPVTVTDPEVTRYFMTVEEAVQLVIQAGAIGRCGEALVLDMGEPVKIAEVAQRLIEQSGKRVRIEYTGLRDGEKLSEVLLGEGEEDVRPFHPLVRHVPSQPIAPAQLESAGLLRDKASLVELFGQVRASGDSSDRRHAEVRELPRR